MELLYLDQNYLSRIVKRKVAFRELEPAQRAAVARGAVVVPESEAHRLESAARPDLPLLGLLRELFGGLTLPHERGPVEPHCEWRLEAIPERDFPARRSRASDRVDVRSNRGRFAPLPARHLRRVRAPTSSAGPVSTFASAASSSRPPHGRRSVATQDSTNSPGGRSP